MSRGRPSIRTAITSGRGHPWWVLCLLATIGCGPPAVSGLAGGDPLLGGGTPVPRTGTGPGTAASTPKPSDPLVDLRNLPNPNPPPSTAALTVGMGNGVDTSPKLEIGSGANPGGQVAPGVWQKQGTILRDPIAVPDPGVAGSVTPVTATAGAPRIDSMDAARAWLAQRGISLFNWLPDQSKTQYRFICSVPSPTQQEPNRTLTYEYPPAPNFGDPVEAARKVIEKIYNDGK